MNGHLVSVTRIATKNSLRLVHYVENSLRNLLHALRRVHIFQPPEPPVVRRQWRRHLGVRFEPWRYDFFAVIGTLHQLATVGVANSRYLRGAIINIVNLATRLAHTAPGDPAHQQCRINYKMNYHRLFQSMLPEQFAEPLSLRHGTRKSIEYEAERTVRTLDALGYHLQDDGVGYQFPASHQRLGLFAQRISQSDIFAQHIAGRKMRHSVLLGQLLSLRAFARSGRSEKNNRALQPTHEPGVRHRSALLHYRRPRNRPFRANPS